MDRFLEMKTFAAVVDAGSFVRAAQALNTSKTAVSRLVGDLEARLGVRLMQRTTRKLSLTEEGAAFHARCKDLLSGLDEAEAEVTAHVGDVVGQLRVNVPTSFGLMHLAPLWAEFLRRHPKVTLEVSLVDRLVDLVDEGYDLAVRIARLPSSSLVCRKLTSTRMVLCASPGYLQQHGHPAVPADLASHPVLTYSLLATGDSWEFDGPQGPESVKVTPRLQSNNGETCLAAAIRDQGVILQPSFLVAEHLASGALVELMPQFRSIELGVYAVYPTRRHLPTKVRVMVDYLVQAFRVPAWPA
jgi:DNA-binding transcriptional LysR family regulator